MTFSAEQYRENIGKNEPLPQRTRAYFQQRFRQQVFAKIAKALADRAEEFGLSKSGLAVLIDKDKAQVNRVISNPSNMTLDTVSEILLALNYEPSLEIEDLSVPPLHNYCHPVYTVPRGISGAGFVSATKDSAPISVGPSPNWKLESAL